MNRLLRYLRFSLAYLAGATWDTGISPPELLAYLATHPAGRALDLGCGTGTNVITLAGYGWQATGVDYIPRSIRTARKKARRRGVQAQFFIDSVTRLHQLAGPYDLILDMGCYHGLDSADGEAYRANIRRLLAEDGTLLLYGFTRDPAGDQPFGITTDDVSAFSEFLFLRTRVDGVDVGRPSAWFTFTRRN